MRNLKCVIAGSRSLGLKKVNEKLIQMTLDERLIKSVDKTIKKLKITRSAFTRNALQHEVDNVNILELEKKQINGYKKFPEKEIEFSIWQNEQIWKD